jgi:hypothetical protein
MLCVVDGIEFVEGGIDVTGVGLESIEAGREWEAEGGDAHAPSSMAPDTTNERSKKRCRDTSGECPRLSDK